MSTQVLPAELKPKSHELSGFKRARTRRIKETQKVDSLFENTASQNGKGLSLRNNLNCLSGKEWIQETVSVWRQRGLGASHPHTKFERMHPAPFSFQDVARLIQYFTKEDMLVLDPFAGVGSTLKAAALTNRRGIGVELSPKWAELASKRLKEETPGLNGQDIWCMDVRKAIDKIAPDSIRLHSHESPLLGNPKQESRSQSTRDKGVPRTIQVLFNRCPGSRKYRGLRHFP